MDRVSARREDAAWVAAAWAEDTTRVLVLDEGQALIRFGAGPAGTGAPAGTAGAAGAAAPAGTAGPAGTAAPAGGVGPAGAAGTAELVLVPPSAAPAGVRFLLGVDADGIAYFGVMGPAGGLGARPVPPIGAVMPASPAGVRPAALRQAGPLLGDRDAGLFTHAVALANWHARHTHCPRCGAETIPAPAGHARRCPVDGSEHFPRIDPAVIMLVTDELDRCLLARNRAWPPHRVSILAGFVEAGESAEQAVAREVREETGVEVAEVSYLGSQPWPMPQSLMLGFRAQARPGQEIRVDDTEIAEARWFSRAELGAAAATGEVLLPPPVSIAHQIIRTWYGGPLPGTW